MKIKKQQNTTRILIPVGIVTALIIVLSITRNGISKKNPNIKVVDKTIDTETPTTVVKEYGIREMLERNEDIVHSDSICSIYFKKINGTSKIFYVYKDSLTSRQKKDRFFVHVVPKNIKELLKVQAYKYINVDFIDINPREYIINNIKHYVFQGNFTHKKLNRFLKVANINFFNTGRFDPKLGRSYNVSKLRLNKIKEEEPNNVLEKITLQLSYTDFEKIKKQRTESLKSAILSKTEDDFVDCFVSLGNNNKIKSKIRLKGDWTDHLNDEKKWSFRVILEEEKTIRGMKKFSIQHPKVRHYIWEWFFNKIIKDNNLMGLRYDFVDVDLIVDQENEKRSIQIGIMGFEESFDKRLIENNKRREGVILSFDESHLWNDRKESLDHKLKVNSRNSKLQTTKNLPIKVYEESRILSDPILSKQFNVARDLLNGLKKGELKISEVFDIDKLTMFVALSNLFGAHHGLIDHNLKIYFNPITNKLEPIAFDSHGGYGIDKISHYPFSNNDPIYTSKLLEKLELVSSTNFIKTFIDKFENDFNNITDDLNSEFNYKTSFWILDYNSNFIKKKINPSTTTISNLIKIDNNEFQIKISNVSDFPVSIEGIKHINGKTLSKTFINKPTILPNADTILTFKLKNSFNNAFVSKKNKKGGFRYPKDIKKIKIEHRIDGLSFTRNNTIIPYGSPKNIRLKKNKTYLNSFASNFKDFNFIRSSNDHITFVKGKHQLKKNILIPENKKVFFESGCIIDLTNRASIISYSPIIAKGNKQKTIQFISSDNTGGGIFISGPKEQSIIDYCEFNNLSNPSSTIWNVSGAVNFHETRVDISNSIFKNNRSEDGLNIIRSVFQITNSNFENTFSDAFDGDFVTGIIQNCNFVNSGNDGIDISGSKILVHNVKVKNSSDKAISAGESSTIEGNNIQISGGEIGIVSKDLSSISLKNVTISDTRLGLSSFQKKPEFGKGTISISSLTLMNNELDHLIENHSELKIDDLPVKTVSDNVINQMYGNEYGKSSK